MKTYFIFGGDACRVYEEENQNIQAVIDAYEANEITYETLVFDSEKDTPTSLLAAYDGWSNYMVITEEEYNTLLK